MTSSPDRQRILSLVDEAIAAGARPASCWRLLGISQRCARRWRRDQLGDRRPGANRPPAGNALDHDERRRIVEIASQPEHASRPPAQIVAALADEGVYVASESTFYRVLRSEGMAARRGQARAPSRKSPPPTHRASAPNQVWCWDITWLAGPVKGTFYRLYLILDLYSRKIVACEVWEEENSARAGELVQRACLAEGLAAQPSWLVLHGDNGSALKAGNLDALFARLQIKPSRSRPRVSNDNAFAESMFRTAKYHPSLPPAGFATLEQAREWASQFCQWYNRQHRHRSLKFVTPEQKHKAEDIEILAKRHELYEQAKANRPERWIQRRTRDWTPVQSTALNPLNERELEKIIKKSA